jgi:hypothetical protein
MGAICLSRFCRSQAIRHKYLDAFLKHLWKIATVDVDSLSAWQREGQEQERWQKAALVAERLEEPLKSDYLRLIERVLEIGKYGAPDRAESRCCLRQAMQIVQSYDVALPDQALFEKSSPGMQGRGRPVRAELLQKWKALA